MSTAAHPPRAVPLHRLVRPVAEDGWELHYAPMSGGICVMKGDEMKSAEGWPEHHELIAAFQAHRASGELTLKDTITYGHRMFHGHSGRVDIYAWTNAPAMPTASNGHP